MHKNPHENGRGASWKEEGVSSSVEVMWRGYDQTTWYTHVKLKKKGQTATLKCSGI